MLRPAMTIAVDLGRKATKVSKGAKIRNRYNQVPHLTNKQTKTCTCMLSRKATFWYSKKHLSTQTKRFSGVCVSGVLSTSRKQSFLAIHTNK